MAYKRSILMFFIFILFSTLCYANTIECDIDQNPLIPQILGDFKIPVICSSADLVTNDFFCYTKVMGYYDTDLSEYVPRLFQVNPKFTDDINVIDVFADSQYTSFNLPTGVGYLNAYITAENLQINTNYTLGVICSGGGVEVMTYNTTFIPTYKSMSIVGDKMVWFNENTSYIVALFFIILACCVILGYLIHTIKQDR